MTPEAGASLEERVGYVFRDRELFLRALTHRSATGRRSGNNEKLEFLGDAVLALAVSDLVMRRFPEADEGELSKLRAALVNAHVLCGKAIELRLGDALRMGKGEERSGGRGKESILAAAYEALLGAVFLDGGFEAARGVIERHFGDDLARSPEQQLRDHKTRLQELTQRRFHETPSYRVVRATGPDHDRDFVTEITVAGRLYGRGQGKSKKESEQRAALEALAELAKEG